MARSKVSGRVVRAVLLFLLTGLMIFDLDRSPDQAFADFRSKAAAINMASNEVTTAFQSPPSQHTIDSRTNNQNAGNSVSINAAVTDGVAVFSVSGTYLWQNNLNTTSKADAECSTEQLTTQDLWLAHRYVNQNGGTAIDRLDLMAWVDGGVKQFDWTPDFPSITNPECAGDPNHTYRVTVTADTTFSRSIRYGFFIYDQENTMTNHLGQLHLDSGTLGPMTRNYRCGKRTQQDPSITTTSTSVNEVGAIETATVTVDTRQNTIDEGSLPTSSAYYVNSGHWGVYTCNWLDPHETYYLVVSGKYKYDQTAPPGYAEADAECATGYPPGPATPTSTEWQEENIPHYYRHIATDTVTGGPRDSLFANYDPYSADRFTTSTADWKPTRYLVNDSKAPIADMLDLWVNFASVTWTARTPDSNGCDPNHVYYTPLPTQLSGPVYLKINEVRDYYEWDNCGALHVLVTRHSDALPVTEPGSSSTSCKWTPQGYAREIREGEGPSLREDPKREGTAEPEAKVIDKTAWFYAKDVVVRPDSSAGLFWKNTGYLPHTASVEKVIAERGNTRQVILERTFNGGTGQWDVTTAATTEATNNGLVFDSDPTNLCYYPTNISSDTCTRHGERFPVTSEVRFSFTTTPSYTHRYVVIYACKIMHQDAEGNSIKMTGRIVVQNPDPPD